VDFIDALIVPNVAAIGGNDADPLAAIVGATAADGDDQVALFVLKYLEAIVNIGIGRVGHGSVKNHAINAGVLLDQVNDLLGNAGLGNPFVVQIKGFLPRATFTCLPISL